MKKIVVDFPTFSKVLDDMELDQYPIGSSERMDAIIAAMKGVHEGYMQRLGLWGRIKCWVWLLWH